MANPDHLAMLKGGVQNWNSWRRMNPDVLPDLRRVNLAGVDLRTSNFCGADLYGADFDEADLTHADLSEADLTAAKFVRTDLTGANLRRAKIERCNIIESTFMGATLVGADLTATQFIRSNFENSDLTGCLVYGISVWDVQLDGAVQSSLVVTPKYAPAVTVDDLEVAQLIYLLLNNQKIRHVIDTISSKVVLILGRFTAGRKAVLDAIREELRNRDYLPVLFDFEKPSSKTTLETVSTLAHISRFVIADLTDAKSVLQELQAIVPSNPSLPVQPLLLNSQAEPGMFDFVRTFPWVLEPYLYEDQNRLLAAITNRVIGPAEALRHQR